MHQHKKLLVSHAPYWHNGDCICSRNFNVILAAIPAVAMGINYYGIAALRVVALSMACSILWELGMKYATKRPITITDGSSALIGLIFGMLLPATAAWWLIILGTFFAVVIGREIFGGIGGNPFNPVLIAVAVLTLSWNDIFDYYGALVNYQTAFPMIYPLETLKSFGTAAVADFSVWNMLLGKQIGGIGTTFGLGLILGGVYLMLRGFIRWEISISFIVGILITAHLFNMSDPNKYATPLFHLCTGYTLIGAFFLATDDSSSPVNFVPMLLYGAICGILTMLIRNIGAYADGVVFAILFMNLINPLLDRIRPKAFGKVTDHA